MLELMAYWILKKVGSNHKDVDLTTKRLTY